MEFCFIPGFSSLTFIMFLTFPIFFCLVYHCFCHFIYTCGCSLYSHIFCPICRTIIILTGSLSIALLSVCLILDMDFVTIWFCSSMIGIGLSVGVLQPVKGWFKINGSGGIVDVCNCCGGEIVVGNGKWRVVVSWGEFLAWTLPEYLFLRKGILGGGPLFLVGCGV